MGFRSVPTLLPFVLLAPLASCAASSPREGFDTPTGDVTQTPETNTPVGDFEDKPATPPGELPEVNEVFGHSEDTLYRLDAKTKEVAPVGMFDGCASVLDIALDERSNLFAVNYDALYTVDKATAKCTEIARGKYPNSLSFVPKGTVDPAAEALVGYEEGDYVRIDTKTGSKSKIGTLGGNLRSSGDVVSVKGGKTYLTAKDERKGSCTTFDCLVEVDPATGQLVKNWGSIEHKDVFGLSFWGGKVYGFGREGSLFEVTFGTNQLATTTIPVPNRPANLSFWGAGSSTSAPLVATPQ